MSKIFVANWKMQLSYKDSLKLAQAFKNIFKNYPFSPARQVVLAPDFLSLPEIAKIIKTSPIKLGALDCAPESKGAFTGEVSAQNLKTLGAQYVVVGHSERRQYFFENEILINQKLIVAQAAKLIPILCVGESREEKRVNLTKEVLANQLRRALKNVKSNLIIAYEPRWAIGSGQTPSPAEIEAIHIYIKKLALQILKKELKVIYGGSVSAANIQEFKKCKNVDGFLVGGASLKAQEFYKICQL